MRTPITLPLILLMAALAGYLLPWAIAPSGPMTLNAFDLAEWISLHPSQNHTAPPLQASLLLRLQLTIICLIFAGLLGNKPWRLVSVLFIVLLALAQLPPPEFALDIGNLNYRQQFDLAIASLTGGLLLLLGRPGRILTAILVVLPCAGAVTAIAGFAQAYDVYATLQSSGTIGSGIRVLVTSYAGIFLAAALPHFKRRPQS